MPMSDHVSHNRGLAAHATAWLLPLAIALSGCSTLGGSRDFATQPPFMAGQEAARVQLSDGYSELY